MSDDQQLLARYAKGRSEAAFAELVARHVALVYATALRRTEGDAHLAQDVAQEVFTDLARKAPLLPENVVLAGWLHRATRYAAAQATRTNRRRHQREQEAVAMNTLCSPNQTDWEQIRPLLDEALDQLNPTERDALLLRFFEQRSLADVGRALGANEDAARKRVSRALDKLRALLAHRGLTTTAGALSAAISANAMPTAPAGLATTLASASLAGAAAGATTTFTLLNAMGLTKLQLGVTALVLAGATTGLLVQHRSQTALREENSDLHRQIAQLQASEEALSNRLAQGAGLVLARLPKPPAQFSAPVATPLADLPTTNLYARFKDKSPKLTLEQVGSYLKANGRNAASLLAAYRTTGESSLLSEAMTRFPNEPQVAFEAAFRKEATPAERSQWLEALKTLDPENSLPNYLAASADFQAGRMDQAAQELMAAAGKQAFQDYSVSRDQNDEEAFLAAGYSPAEAKTLASLQLVQPQLLELKQLSDSMLGLAQAYQQAGDPASAQAALQMAVQLGQRYATSSPGEALVSQLLGLTLEQNALRAMDPTAPYGGAGQTVQERLNALGQQTTQLREYAQQTAALFPTLSDQDWLSYKDRWKSSGEEAAERWLINKYGQK